MISNVSMFSKMKIVDNPQRCFSTERGLIGKRCIITGSTSGIGLGIARSLAKEGCSLMLNGFGDAKEIDQLQKSLRKEFNVNIEYHPADMTKPMEIKDMIAKSESIFGGVDILINNAGIQHVSPIEDFPLEKWDSIIAINLSSSFHTIKGCLPGMKTRKWGRIINIASVHGLVASVNKSAYVAAKHGIVGLTKAVALETAGSGVTCNSINPGWVRTPLVEKQIEAKAKQNNISIGAAAEELLREKQPSKQFVSVEQLAGTVIFLCSENANQITGISVPVDGGWTAQ